MAPFSLIEVTIYPPFILTPDLLVVSVVSPVCCIDMGIYLAASKLIYCLLETLQTAHSVK